MDEPKLKQDIYIGNNIRELREQIGLTQEQTAAQLETALHYKITRSTYAKYESGIANIPISVLKQLKIIFKLKSYDPFFKE